MPLDDRQAVPRQVHVGDDLGVEQADRVAGDRVAEAGMELLGHRRAADDAAPLQHRDLQAGAGEIEGADEAVVAAADDDDVPLVHAGNVEHGRSFTPNSPRRGAARSLFRNLRRWTFGGAGGLVGAEFRRQTP